MPTCAVRSSLRMSIASILHLCFPASVIVNGRLDGGVCSSLPSALDLQFCLIASDQSVKPVSGKIQASGLAPSVVCSLREPVRSSVVPAFTCSAALRFIVERALRTAQADWGSRLGLNRPRPGPIHWRSGSRAQSRHPWQEQGSFVQ